jgi:hypothetical protein
MSLGHRSQQVVGRRADWSRVLLPIACVLLAAWLLQANRLSEWATSIAVLGPALWVVFGGPTFVGTWQKHRVPVVRGIMFLLRIAFGIVVLRYVAPLVVSFLDRLLNA